MVVERSSLPCDRFCVHGISADKCLFKRRLLGRQPTVERVWTLFGRRQVVRCFRRSGANGHVRPDAGWPKCGIVTSYARCGWIEIAMGVPGPIRSCPSACSAGARAGLLTTRTKANSVAIASRLRRAYRALHLANPIRSTRGSRRRPRRERVSFGRRPERAASIPLASWMIALAIDVAILANYRQSEGGSPRAGMTRRLSKAPRPKHRSR